MADLPVSLRKKDIHTKLRYAETRRIELLNHIARGYVEGFEPAYLANLTDDILANSRECFDYLAHDLIDAYVIPNATDQWRQQYVDGRKKINFPYFVKQVTEWEKINGIDPIVVEKLRQLVKAMDDDLNIDDTLFEVRNFRVVQGIVNSKKHSKVSVVRLTDDTVNFFESEGIVILTKVDADGKGYWSTFIGGNDETKKIALDAIRGMEPRKVGEYKFEANGHNIRSLCLFAVRATMILMDWWYETQFAPTGYRINDYLPENVDPSIVLAFPRFVAQPGQTMTVTQSFEPSVPRPPWQFGPKAG